MWPAIDVRSNLYKRFTMIFVYAALGSLAEETETLIHASMHTELRTGVDGAGCQRWEAKIVRGLVENYGIAIAEVARQAGSRRQGHPDASLSI
jgi:hypothetical protein